jgi:hypothetical protein
MRVVLGCILILALASVIQPASATNGEPGGCTIVTPPLGKPNVGNAACNFIAIGPIANMFCTDLPLPSGHCRIYVINQSTGQQCVVDGEKPARGTCPVQPAKKYSCFVFWEKTPILPLTIKMAGCRT